MCSHDKACYEAIFFVSVFNQLNGSNMAFVCLRTSKQLNGSVMTFVCLRKNFFVGGSQRPRAAMICSFLNRGENRKCPSSYSPSLCLGVHSCMPPHTAAKVKTTKFRRPAPRRKCSTQNKVKVKNMNIIRRVQYFVCTLKYILLKCMNLYSLCVQYIVM